MKKRLLFAFVTALAQPLFAQETNGYFFNTADRISISGRIKNYHRNESNRFITIKPRDITGMGKDTSVYISDEGIFGVQVYQPFEGDMAIAYNNATVYLYVQRNESINIEIDDERWKPRAQNNDALVIQGRSAAVSREMGRFKSQLDSQKFTYDPPIGDRNKPDADFAREVTVRMNEQLVFLEKYIKQNAVIDQKFTGWARNEIVFNTGRTIAYNCFASKRNTTITYPQLMALLEPIPVNQSQVPNNSYYYRFLSLLSSDFEIIANLNPVYKDSIRLLGNNPVLLQVQQMDRYTSGLSKELMYYYEFRGQAARKNPNARKYQNIFASVITEPYLSKNFRELAISPEPFVPYNIVQKIRTQPGGDTLAQKIGTLLAANKNSYVYIDFWGSWCAPCMGEMPHYPALINELKGLPITFVFLAVDTPEKDQQEVKTKHRINGQFIRLTQNETGILNNSFGFKSYPSHFLIDPHGMVIRNELADIMMRVNGKSVLGGELREVVSR